MDRTSSTIEISDVVDQDSDPTCFRIEGLGAPVSNTAVATVAPWVEEPQIPLSKPSSFSRSLGFGSKTSLTSIVSLRQNSTSRTPRPSESQSTLYAPSDSNRRSGDDGESSRSIAPSSASAPGELRKSKSSLNLFSKLRSRPSKAHLRHDSEDSEHPSLRPPVPPLPEQKPFFSITLPGTPLLVKKERKVKNKKDSEEMAVPCPPPETENLFGEWERELKGPINVDAMNGIVNFDIVTDGPNGLASSSSPSSAFDSSQSYSDHSFHSANFVLPSEFSDPFSSTPIQEKRRAIFPSHGDFRKVSPKTLVPPYASNGVNPSSSTTLVSGPGSPTWVPPESWAVEKTNDDPYNPSGNLESSEAHDSGSDENLHTIPTSLVNSRRRTIGYDYDVPRSRKGKQPNAAEYRITFRVKEAPPDFSYKMKIYRQDNSYHVVAIKLQSTVSELNAKLARKLLSADDRVQHNLYLKERGQERMLGQHESPAAIVKLRMEQAGYDFEDGAHLLGIESLGILARFLYKSQLLAGEDQISFDTYDFVDLSGRGLRTIPVVLHQKADAIISLRLSRNPMIEIPLDFIQACSTLRELRLTHMYMKKVPQSLRHSQTLQRLDLSCNSIKDLDDAYLDYIQNLNGLFLQNNRLEKLPWHFPRLRSLVTLNISNNKFRTFPILVTQLENLRNLDISFNMITELPEAIGKMMMLEHFILLGNQVTKFPDECRGLVNLRILDCRRNQISDLTPICMLPLISDLSARHNAVHALDLSLGPDMTTLDASHNDITQLSLLPGPLERSPPYALTALDISYAKLSSLDIALGQLSSLRTLKFDHNSIRSIPDTLGDLKWLETLSCTDNKLDALPSTIGKLQKLEVLDAHNNSLMELPQSIWNCASLTKINITSNLLASWHDPPMVVQEADENSNYSTPSRRISGSSIASTTVSSIRPNYPPLVYSLEKLYLGENCLTDNVILPLMIFKELRVLNLSFNEIQDLPPAFFRNMLNLEELYLSGNKLTSIPAEDLHRLTRLTTLYLNGNKLHTLPQELGKVTHLTILDVGSNSLKYNINNWEFDWNWNFNTNLKYLNLSGNKRLQIKDDPSRASDHLYKGRVTTELSGFTSLKRLKVLGLMDVTITPTAKDTAVDIPDETADRRIRTSLSTVCGMGYGIADSLGKNDALNMVDLVHEFHGRKDEALFAMFGRTHPCKGVQPGTSTNYLSKFLHDHFVGVFLTQMASVREKQRESVPERQWNDGIPKALHWTFLKLNQDLYESLRVAPRKNSQASINSHVVAESQLFKTGVSGIVLYFKQKTLFAANVGDALAVVSRQGVAQEISRKHDPYDRLEAARIRAAEGYISPPGLVNDEVDVSRSFGFFRDFPTLNAKPDIFVYNLSELDEFVIIANRGLWDFVPFQTAVDIARTVVRMERSDPMLAAQKLRDFAISYGADGSTMIMVISLFDSTPRSRQPTIDAIVDPQMYRSKKKDETRDRGLNRLLEEVPPPTGQVTIVFTDIRNSTHLWEANPGMATAMRLHNSLLRRQLRFCGGYEVKTEGDSFMCSFPTALAAVWWCLSVQRQLLEESWPLEILECEDGKSIYDSEGHLIARGLSVRMGIHSGMPLCETDPITRRMDYFGPMVNRSARINSSALGGQIMCSQDIIREIKARVLGSDSELELSRVQSSQVVEAIRRIGVVVIEMGEYKLKGIELPEILSIIYPSGLEGRHDLKEAPADPTASGSRVQFSVPQMQELGLLCLRIEAISSARVFKRTPERKGSIQSNNDPAQTVASHTFLGDPNVLLPPMNDTSSDSDLMLLLDSFALRIENAVNTLYTKLENSGRIPSSRSSRLAQITPAPEDSGPSNASTLVHALREEGALDESTLKYISSVLRRL